MRKEDIANKIHARINHLFFKMDRDKGAEDELVFLNDLWAQINELGPYEK